MALVSQASVSAAGWRLKLGVGRFGFSIALPALGVPMVAAIGLLAETVATVPGVMLVGAEYLGKLL